MYIILAIISILLLLIAIYKLKYQFWSRQPVFHFHNLKYWLIPPGIIQHDKPVKDKFYDKDIYFDTYFNTPTKKKALFAHFIQGHFLPHKKEKYNPPKNGVLNYFKAHNDKSYLSMMYDKNNFKLIGAMSTRPLDCYIGDKKLPDKENYTIINPDNALSTLLKIGDDEILTYFNLQKYLNQHHYVRKPSS
jgi:hypothetical protein